MNSVLVTGGAGFIGSSFVRHLLHRAPGTRVTNLDALTYAGSLENLSDLPGPEHHRFVEGNIRDQGLVEELLRQEAVDTVVHFAAETHVDRSIADPSPFVETNVIGTLTLLEAARHVWLEERPEQHADRRFLQVSTDEVYGSLEVEDAPACETSPYRPNSPYAASKAAGDHFARAFSRTYGLPVLIANCSNNYGPRQFPEKLIPLTILNAREGKPIPVYHAGQQIRDWIHVDDCCEALLGLLHRGRIGESYNIGGGSQITNLEVVERVCSLMDDLSPDSPNAPHRRLIEFVADRPGHDRRYALDISKLQTELGWAPHWELGDGLRKTVEWYLGNSSWLEAIQTRPSFRHWIVRNYADRKRLA